MNSTEKTLLTYLHSFSLNIDELINTPCEKEEIYNDVEYQSIIEEYFKRLPYSNLSSNTHTIRFDKSGTAFIKQLFNKYVDDDTLVISTKYEHDNVVDCLNKCKNTLILDSSALHQGVSSSLVDEILKYKKVFVYIIGTQISTGEITPQFYFHELKQLFINNRIENNIVLDDVHGMFFFPRDYSIFDHILYTAHAIVPQYEMGMLISKNEKAIGRKIFNWAKNYLPRLDKVLATTVNLAMFKAVLSDYFSDLVGKYTYLKPFDLTVNHIFALQTYNLTFKEGTYERLKKYGIIVRKTDMPINLIRIRFQEFLLQDAESAIEGLKLAHDALHNAIKFAQLRGDI